MIAEVAITGQSTSYDIWFDRLLASGMLHDTAATVVTEAYLHGKPARREKRSTNATVRNAEFWNSKFLQALPAEIYPSEPLVLALARYFGQEQTSSPILISRIATVAPDTVRKAVRYSGVILRPDSKRWAEISQLAADKPAEFAEIVRIGQVLQSSHRQHVELTMQLRQVLARLSPVELLAYACLYAFEHLVPQTYPERNSQAHSNTQQAWDALNSILIWKLTTCTDDSFELTDEAIAKSMRTHLTPFLFPSPDDSPVRETTYRAYEDLVAAQIELNEFLSRSVDAFCYDDSIAFTFVGDRLEIVELDPAATAAWTLNGEKLHRLHNYWFYRAMDAFAATGMAAEQIGRPENHRMNQIAFTRALRTKLQLTEVYGLDESVQTETGFRVDLFQALLSLELMTAFFNTDFVFPFVEYLNKGDHWRMALARLAMAGLAQPDPQNRFPMTWADRESKITNIQPWTVSKEFPKGHARTAEAILDFWTNDLVTLSARLRAGQPGLNPDLYERPVLKIGRYLFQLPWLVAMQNNASAAINNLRRIGTRRAEVQVETRRIESRLAKQFEVRGFLVSLNYQPAQNGEDDAGEVDLICARDGQLLVLEIKSTFLRRSLKDSWLHKTATLRKAGLQLLRKVEAVSTALDTDTELASSLGWPQGSAPVVTGWIVDTSIEHDHEYFSDFLKVSVEEVLIALRDESHLLNDPEGLFSGDRFPIQERSAQNMDTLETLYPHGFSAARFIDVIKQGRIWKRDADDFC